MLVLILEDDDNLRELLVDAVESMDYEVHAAESARVALNLGRDYDFDLVISDIRMAGPTDGLGVLQALKKARPSLACIVITGYADHTAPLRALQIKVDDYLYKPFQVQDIVAAVQRVRESKSQRTWFRQVLHRLLGQVASDQALNELQTTREQCLKGLFLAIRSQLVYAETALAAWDVWEELEVEYLQIANSNSVRADTVQRLLDRYGLWQAKMAKDAENKAFVASTQRPAEGVDRATFRRFVDRIKQAQVSAEELGLAVTLRRIPPDRRSRNVELEKLHQRMWA
jgi:YesN/AraC family two-component response regulator